MVSSYSQRVSAGIEDVLAAKRARYLLFTLFAMLVIWDRYYVAGIAQWGVDQGSHLWLGSVLLQNYPRVGLASSYSVFNPNGFPLLSWFLSFLPTLRSISAALGVLQALVMLVLAHQLLDDRYAKWTFLLVAVAAPAMKGISIELNQLWIFASLTPLCALLLFVVITGRAGFWIFFSLWFLLMFCAAIYFSGIILPIVFVLIVLFCVAAPKLLGASVTKPFVIHEIWGVRSVAAALCALCASSLLTWLPYFSVVNPLDLAGLAEPDYWMRMKMGYEAVLMTPLYLYGFTDLLWGPNLSAPDILGPGLSRLALLLSWQLKIQYLSLCGLIVFLVSKAVFRRRATGRTLDSKAVFVLALGLLPLWAAIASAWMGGPLFHRGERGNISIQFLPFFLILVFPAYELLLAELPVLEWVLKPLSRANAVLFFCLAMASTPWLVLQHLEYRGDELLGPDVALLYKEQAIAFIANDWLQVGQGSTVVPVDYDLTGAWPWIPEWGAKNAVVHGAVYTFGRPYDWQFMRTYGWANYQEGTVERRVGTGRYVISYASNPTSFPPEEIVLAREFGRLRVTILKTWDKNPS